MASPPVSQPKSHHQQCWGQACSVNSQNRAPMHRLPGSTCCRVNLDRSITNLWYKPSIKALCKDPLLMAPQVGPAPRQVEKQVNACSCGWQCAVLCLPGRLLLPSSIPRGDLYHNLHGPVINWEAKPATSSKSEHDVAGESHILPARVHAGTNIFVSPAFFLSPSHVPLQHSPLLPSSSFLSGDWVQRKRLTPQTHPSWDLNTSLWVVPALASSAHTIFASPDAGKCQDSTAHPKSVSIYTLRPPSTCPWRTAHQPDMGSSWSTVLLLTLLKMQGTVSLEGSQPISLSLGASLGCV